MPITASVGSEIAEPGQLINLSSLFSVTSSTSNPTYIDVTLLDRDEYPYTIGGRNLGGFISNGAEVAIFHKQDINYLTGANNIDAYDNGIIFSLQQSTGRYYNSTYGYFDQLQYLASTSEYDNTYLTIFATNSLSVINSLSASPTNYYADPETLANLAANAGAGILATFDVITRTDISGPAPSQSTPNQICLAAESYIGKFWNSDGCWVLASNIAAQTGSSLPATTPGGSSIAAAGLSPAAPVSNGEWIVAYDGPALSNASIASAEATAAPGDIITMDFQSGGGHITTVVSGYGVNAMVVDNTEYVNSGGSIINKANDGSPSDIIIENPSLLSSELNKSIANDIVIYRLDTPTVFSYVSTTPLQLNQPVRLSSLFFADDADGAGTRPITSYAVYDTGTSGGTKDTFLLAGKSYSAQGASNAIVVTASQFASLDLVTSGAQGTDVISVSAYNGAYWGDWQNLTVDINAVTPNYNSATAISNYNSNLIRGAISVTDTAANITNNLDTFQSMYSAGYLASITLSDPTEQTLSLTSAQAVNDGSVLGRIDTPHFLQVQGSVGTATYGYDSNNDVVSEIIRTTAATASNYLDQLESVIPATSAGIQFGITLTDSGTPILSLNGAQVTNDSGVLADITSKYSVSVTDTAANVAANLPSLESLVITGKLSGITLTDGGTPVLSISAATQTYDGGALGTISGPYALSVQNGGATTVINPTSYQDTLVAPVANTVIEGAGSDILSLSQNAIASASAAYTITANGDGSVTLATTGSSDHVSGVLQIDFADKTLTLAAKNSMNEYVALLYQGALGRTPDAGGLEYWDNLANALPASAKSLGVYALSDASSIAAGFTGSAEFVEKYGSLNNTQYVTQLYSNVLDRAPDSGGLSYWVSQLSAGESRNDVLVGFAESAEAIGNATQGYVGQSGTHAAWLFLT